MKFFVIPFLSVFLSVSMAYSAQSTVSPSSAERKTEVVVSLSSGFLSELASLDPMKRDRFLSGKMNAIVEGVISVSGVEEKSMLKRRFRISGNLNYGSITLECHIYSDNQDYSSLLAEGQKLSFKGQLVMVTPLNTKRDRYILDIILEDGAAVVE